MLKEMCWDLALDIIDGKNTIDMYLDKGVDINYELGVYLELAVRYNHIKIVKHLIDKGININVRESYALIIAIENNHTKIAKYLIDQGVNLYPYLGYLASKYNNLGILKVIIKKEVPINVIENVNIAAKEGHIRILRYFFNRESSLIYSTIMKLSRYVAEAGHLRIVQYFISLSSGVSTLKFILSQSMYGSCSKNKLNIVKYILKYYIDYFSHYDLNTFYFYSIQNNCNIPTLKQFDKTKKIVYHSKALEKAVEHYAANLIDYLLKKCTSEQINKAFVNCKNHDVSLYLINKGADLHYAEESALKQAIINHNESLVHFLIENGANVNINNEEPLRLALSLELVDNAIVELLIDNGANIYIAEDIIMSHNNPDINTISALSRLFVEQQRCIIDTECGICLTEFKKESINVFICNVCKHAVHKKCQKKWKGKCIYCRN